MKLEKLDKNKHDRESFSCGVKELDDFLKLRANKEQKNHLNVTYVATFADDLNRQPILGYFTLSNISLKEPPNTSHDLFKKVPDTYEVPAILLGRLAVDLNYQGQKIGEFLLKEAFSKIQEAASITGVNAIVVKPKNNAENFYEKYGFHKYQDVGFYILPIKTLKKCE